MAGCCVSCGQPMGRGTGHICQPPPEPKMTVDELLAKLDAEYDRLAADLPEHYEAYGRFRYSYPQDTGYQSDKYDLDRKLARQKEIRSVQNDIRTEERR